MTVDPVIATFVAVAVRVAVALWPTSVLSVEESLGGFADPTVILIACLFC